MDNKAYLKELGRKISDSRKALNISQTKLSKLLNIDRSNLWSIEKGKINTRIITLKIIADALNVDIREFL